MTPTANLPVPTNGHKPPAPIDPVNNLRQLLERSKQQIALAAPKHLTPERMIRVALTAFHRLPALQECSPISILGCVIQAAELGLELTGPLGQAYMVPYFNSNTRQKEAQFQVGYRGLVKLAFNSGMVSYFNAHVVYSNDFFQFEYGTDQKLVHKPALTDRGDAIAVYSVLKLKDGSADFEVMSAQEIEQHRARYSKQKSDKSPWSTAWEEMAKKTPLRRLAKRAPVSVELQTAAVLDEYAEAGVPQGLALSLGEGGQEQAALPVGRQNLRAPHHEPEPQPPDPDVQVQAPERDEQQQLADGEVPIDGDAGAYGDWCSDFEDRVRQCQSTRDTQEVGKYLKATTWLSDGQRREALELIQARNRELAPKK